MNRITDVHDTWSGEIAHALLYFTCQMWKARCQYIHLTKDGTSESAYRNKIKKCENMKKDPLKLMKCDRHLLNRNKKFFLSRSVVVVQMWETRIKYAITLANEKRKVTGKDISRYRQIKRKAKSENRNPNASKKGKIISQNIQK